MSPSDYVEKLLEDHECFEPPFAKQRFMDFCAKEYEELPAEAQKIVYELMQKMTYPRIYIDEDYHTKAIWYLITVHGLHRSFIMNFDCLKDLCKGKSE